MLHVLNKCESDKKKSFCFTFKFFIQDAAERIWTFLSKTCQIIVQGARTCQIIVQGARTCQIIVQGARTSKKGSLLITNYNSNQNKVYNVYLYVNYLYINII